MPNSRKLAHLLVVMAGIYVIHAAAYAIAHPDPIARAVALGGHAYLEAAGFLVGPVMAVGVGVLALRHAKGVGLSLDAPRLAASLAVGFVAVETVERLADPLSVVSEPALFVGLALVVPIAALCTVLVRVATEVARALVGARPAVPARRPTSAPHWVRTEAVTVSRIDVFSRSRRRGPPGVVPIH